MNPDRRLWLIVLILVSAGGLALYSRVAATQQDLAPSEPAYVEPIDNSSLSRVTLSEQAVERLAVATTPVVDDASGDVPRKVIPYSAVIYSPNGETWTY